MIEIDCSPYDKQFETWFFDNRYEIVKHVHASYQLFATQEHKSLGIMAQLEQAVQSVLDRSLPTFRSEEIKELEFSHKQKYAALSISQEEERLLWKKNEHEELTRLQDEKLQQKTEILQLRNQLQNLVLETENRINMEKLASIKTINENNEKLTSQYQQKIGDYLDRYTTSQPATKGKEAELNYEIILNHLFPTAEIKRIAFDPHSCDIELIDHKNNSSILFEIKNYKNNVPKQQIDKFHHDLRTRKRHGIMVSVESGIATKNAFQIDFVKNEHQQQFVALYLPHHQTSHDTLMIAVNIVTFLADWLRMNLHEKEGLHCKQIDDNTMKTIEIQLDMILDTYHDAREALDNAKKILDDKNIHRLKELLGMNPVTIKNQQKSAVCSLSNEQVCVLKEIAPIYRPVLDWKNTGRLILQSDYVTKFGIVKDVLANLGGEFLSHDERLGLLRTKAMRMKEWQKRKE